MNRHRFMIVEHPTTSEEHKDFENFVLPIHTMLGTYHWARLDNAHVFVTGHYEVSMHDRLHKHPKVSVLPSVSSGKQLRTHLALKGAHWNALHTKLSLDSSASMSDTLEAAENVLGPLFSAEK